MVRLECKWIIILPYLTPPRSIFALVWVRSDANDYRSPLILNRFRWVVCQIDYLCELTNDAARRKALTSLPPTLPAKYERILRKVNNSSKDAQKMVQRCLRWIVHCNGKLSVTALCEAISIGGDETCLNREAIPEEDEVLRRCSSLIRKSASDDGLELAHFTVKEFLMSLDRDSNNEFGVYSIDLINDEPDLAVTCLKYLTLDDFACTLVFDDRTLDKQATEYAFRKYAVIMWGNHARSNMTNAGVFSLAKKLLDPLRPNIFLSWARDFVYYKTTDEVQYSLLSASQPLHFAAMLALPDICSWQIECGCGFDDMSDFGSPLHCAILGEHGLQGSNTTFFSDVMNVSPVSHPEMRISTIRALLDAGADPNKHYQLRTRRISPLLMAVYTDLSTVYKDLVSHGAIFDEETAGWLRKRANTHGNGDEYVKKLQAVTLDADSFAALQGPAHHRGVSRYNQTIATNLRDSLLIAAEFGQLGVVKSILQNRLTDMNALNPSTGHTSLHYAARAGHVEILKSLLESGADCNVKDLKGETPLHSSVTREGSQCLALLLQHGIDLHARDLAGFSVWHTAAKENNVEALSLLRTWSLDGHHSNSAVARTTPPQNGEHDMRSHAGLTPLHVAVEACALEAVDFLVNDGFDISALTADGSTMLHSLASNGSGTPNYKIADILLEKGADPCISRMDGKTPLHVLTDWRHYTTEQIWVFQRLVQAAARLDQIDAERMTILDKVCHLDPRSGHISWASRIQALETLLLGGADPSCLNKIGQTAFQSIVDAWESYHMPTSRSDEFTSACATMAGIFMDSYQQAQNLVEIFIPCHLLYMSLWYGYDQLTDKVLVHIPEIDTKLFNVSRKTPLQAACLRGGSLILVRKLLDKSKAEMRNRARGSDLIRFAGQNSTPTALDIMVELLDWDVDPNDCSSLLVFEDGQTALMLAVEAGELPLVELLLARGADPSMKDKTGKSVLHYACHLYGNMSSVFEHILAYTGEVDINARDLYGWTVLHCAASFGWTYEVSLLLSKKADMSIRESREGAMPIHIAAAYGHLGVVLELLDHGCDKEAKNKFGLTPGLIAYKSGHFNIAAKLESYNKGVG